MKGVETFRIIREKLGWNKYTMDKNLGISQKKLNYCEKKAATVNHKLLIKLQELSGMSVQEFWNLVKSCEK